MAPLKIKKFPHFESFLEDHIQSASPIIEPIAGDVSQRKYYRVHDGERSYVIMEWEPFSDPEEFPFFSIQQYFEKNNIDVPRVHHYDAQRGLFLLEDLGDLTLERKFWELYNPENIRPYYELAVDHLSRLHRLISTEKDLSSCSAYNVAFDVDKFVWEMNYSLTHFVKGLCKVSLNDKTEALLQKDFLHLANKLVSMPQVLCHRDYHSRNLMLKKEKLYVIDFQDARTGPAAYDLVSLLHDSYIKTSKDIVSSYIDYYLKITPEVMSQYGSREAFDKDFELQAIQRCFKACGTFGAVYFQREDLRYLRYLPRTLKKVKKALSYFPNELNELRQIVHDVELPMDLIS